MIRAWPRVSVRRTCQALVVGSLLASPLAMAHPHGWIDMSVRVITDDNGVAIGLHQTWRMARPGPVRVVFGAPLRLEGEDYRDLAGRVEEAVRSL